LQAFLRDALKPTVKATVDGRSRRFIGRRTPGLRHQDGLEHSIFSFSSTIASSRRPLRFARPLERRSDEMTDLWFCLGVNLADDILNDTIRVGYALAWRRCASAISGSKEPARNAA
jgi:hypothetical protein